MNYRKTLNSEGCSNLIINKTTIGESYPTYFIADIAANHDGDLGRAKDLIWLAAEAGANAAKFQHFKAKTIVSDHGFKSLREKKSHQGTWKKSVFEVYQDASVSIEWTKTLEETCQKAEIDFFTSPYDKSLVDHIDPYVPAYKVGSGDITWHEIIAYIASKGKPYILATGASTIDEVCAAVEIGLAVNPQLALLQCNTNYTGSLENMHYVQLNVIKTYRELYPKMVLGLSDHTPGHATVLGAIALGGRIIEKHFTDDVLREGPDHAFSMDYEAWREMVDRARELEAALGGKTKRVEDNEKETVVLQRRAIRLVRDLNAGSTVAECDLEVLRPCPEDAMPPYKIRGVIGRKLNTSRVKGDYLRDTDLV